MESVALGQEVSVEEQELWQGIQPSRGQVIEVFMDPTGITSEEDSWAGFFIQDVKVHTDATVTLQVDFVGCSDVSALPQLEQQFHGGGRLHLCPLSACTGAPDEVVGMIHVVKLRLWSVGMYAGCTYLSEDQNKNLTALVEKFNRPEGPPGGKAPRRRAAPKPATAKAPARGPGRKKKEEPPPGDQDGNGGVGRRLTPEMRAHLQDRLKKVKQAATAGDAPGKAGVESVSDGDSDPPSSDAPLDSRLVPDRGLETPGGELAPLGRLADAGPPGDTGKDKAAKRKKDKKKNKVTFADAVPGLRALEATRGGTTTSLKNQLVARALQVAQTKKQKSKKDKEKLSAKTLGNALKKILTGESDGKKSKKKKRKRVTHPDGTIESCSMSSSDSSDTMDEDEKSHSESDLETPVKKRSRDRPGSVLALLTDHVKETLQQGATTGVEETGSTLVSGVKVMTYFMLHIKGSFPTQQRELRELHSLAGIIDTLRQGDLARTGDALAARFMAIHQFLQDQNWRTAQHMELFPMTEVSASTSMVLATRRHAKLVSKAQGFGNSAAWGGQGKGKGNRSGWYPPQDWKAEGNKGDKGKPRKGKGKGRGKPSWDWSASANEWKDKKEKPGDKGE